MASSSSWILSLKILLIVTATVSVAVTMKLTLPIMLNTLPTLWSLITMCFKPPYLYVVINGIIITIAASTRFQHDHDHNHHEIQSPPSDLTAENHHPEIQTPVSFGVTEACGSEESDVGLDSVGSEVVGGNEDEVVTSRLVSDEGDDVVVKSAPPRKAVETETEFGFTVKVKEKELVTSRFAHTRKPVKPSLEGARALRVLKPKKHETLESTWKMITEGRQLPLTRHLHKSDTFNNLHHARDPIESPSTVKPKVVKKSDTFKDRTTYADQNDYPKLKKDVSLGQDELNRRVEAFIKKFNDDMKLQRQESLKQYREMVNRGV